MEEDAEAPVGREDDSLREQQIHRVQQRSAVWKLHWPLWVPEESSAKAEIAGASKRVREQEVASVRVVPDAKLVAAVDRVARLEQAVAATGDFKGAEMDTLVSLLKREQKDAQELLLDAQIRAREAFIERAWKRITPVRRRACGRSFETGGKREAVGRIAGTATRAASSTRCAGCRCDHSS